MKRIQTFLAVLLLGLMSLGAQAQRADELAIDDASSAQERPQRQPRGGRGGGPTLREVNQAARDGDLARARAMVDEVLQRNPDNARAHFVKAQLALRDRDLATARTELQAAERLAPGLPFAREKQVANLRRRLERMDARDGRGDSPRAGRNAREDSTPAARDDTVAGARAETTPGGPAVVPWENRAPSASDAGSTTTTAGDTSTPVETRKAGEDTRNMGAPAPRAADKGGNPMLMGALIGGAIVAALAALLFRRRRPGT